jgi:hypothetical protein
VALSSALVFVLFALGSVALAAGFVCLRLHADAAGGLFLAAGFGLQLVLAKGTPE